MRLIRDELEIRRLLAEYCHLCDEGDFAALVDRFTDDGVFVFAERVASGRVALLRWFETMQSPERRGKHISANPIVEVDGDRAFAVSDFVFLTRSERGLVPLVAGRYRDELRRDGGRWRFRRREAAPL